MSLRPYQQASVEAVESHWRAGNGRVQLVCATAAGKTRMAGFLIAKESGRVLVLAPMRRLVRQFAESLSSNYGIQCSVALSGKRDCGKKVLCATIQTMQRQVRKGRWNADDFSLIVVDESHTSLSDQSLEVLSFFKSRLLGVTATPFRLDGRSFDRLYNAQVEIEDAQMAPLIEAGFLKRITVKTIPIRINVSHDRAVITDSEASNAVEPYLSALADAVAASIGERCGVVFLPLIATSKAFTELLVKRGIRAAHLDGSLGETYVDKVLTDLERGGIQVVCNPLLLGVGIDVRPISFVCVLRPTTSFVQFCQQVGRGVRLWEGDDAWAGQKDMVLLDPIWQSSRINLLQGPHSIFARSPEEAEELREAVQSTECDLLSTTLRVRADREESLRRLALENAHRQERLVNATEFFAEKPTLPINPRWQQIPPTESQIKVLSANGFDVGTFSSRAEASAAVDSILDRLKKGLAPYKLAKEAKLLGNPNAFLLTLSEAKAFIEQSFEESKV